MLLIELAKLVWTVVGILGPLFILALYPVFERTKLLSPFLVAPGMVGLTLFLYFFWGPHLQYSHFLVGSGVFFALYLPAVFRWGYGSTDAFVLSALAVLGADQLWQLPIYLDDWSKGLPAAEFGLAGAGFSMMSIPLFVYFLYRAGTPKMGAREELALALSATISASLLSVYWVSTFDYLAFFSWAAVFGLLTRAALRPLSNRALSEGAASRDARP